MNVPPPAIHRPNHKTPINAVQNNLKRSNSPSIHPPNQTQGKTKEIVMRKLNHSTHGISLVCDDVTEMTRNLIPTLLAISSVAHAETSLHALASTL